jgi:hypothetical protein
MVQVETSISHIEQETVSPAQARAMSPVEAKVFVGLHQPIKIAVDDTTLFTS